MKLSKNLINFICSVFFIFQLLTEKLINAKLIFKNMKLNSIPEVLPSYSIISGNFTHFEQFKIIMLNMNVSRYQAKEVFLFKK